MTLPLAESQLPRLKNGAVKSSLQSSRAAGVCEVRTTLGTDLGSYPGKKTVIVRGLVCFFVILTWKSLKLGLGRGFA